MRVFRLAFRACDLLGPVLHELLGLGSSTYELKTLFGFEPARTRQLAWASAALTCKNWNLARLIRRGGGLRALRGLVSWRSSADILLAWQREGIPMLFLTWHLGAPVAIEFGLELAGLRTLCCVGPPPCFQLPEHLDYVFTDGGPMQRAQALHHCLQRLRSGGAVYLAADHPWVSSRRAACLGREVSLAPGIGTLARLTGARLVPIVSAWTPQGRLEVRHFDPLVVASGAGEEEIFQVVAAWFESYLRAHPEDLEQQFLSKLLHAAPLAGLT